MLQQRLSPLYQSFQIYDYPFSTPTNNAANKRIIERPISFPPAAGEQYTYPYCRVLLFTAVRKDIRQAPPPQYRLFAVYHGDCRIRHYQQYTSAWEVEIEILNKYVSVNIIPHKYRFVKEINIISTKNIFRQSAVTESSIFE